MINNTKLEDLLFEWKNGDIETQIVENNILDDTMFLIPVKQCKAIEDGGSMIQFILAEKNEGTYIIAFTSEEELQKGMEEQLFILLSFAEIIALSTQKEEITGILINPYSVVYRVSDKLTQKESKEKLMIGEPIEYPTEFLGMIMSLLSKEDIEKAWFVVMQKGYETPEYLLILDGNYESKQLYESIRKIAITKLEGIGMAITNSKELIGEKVIKKYPPFWSKITGVSNFIFD